MDFGDANGLYLIEITNFLINMHLLLLYVFVKQFVQLISNIC